MKTEYRVLWQEGEGAVVAGQLELLPQGANFSPADAGSSKKIHFEDLAGIRIALKPEERLEGKPTVIAERVAAPPISIASLAKRSLAVELARGFEAAGLGGDTAPARLLVVVPLREESVLEAERLLRSGPPFTPEQVGLDRHEAYLTANEAVLLFESFEGEEKLRRLMTSAPVWEAAPVWRKLIAGPPRIAQTLYAWEDGNSSSDTSDGGEA